jgi:hypothetical protein
MYGAAGYAARNAFCTASGARSMNQKIGACRPLGLAHALLPMAKRVDAEPEPGGERLLGHAEPRSDRLHVDRLRDMDAVGLGVSLAPGVGNRLLEAAPDAVRYLAHVRFLLNIPDQNPGQTLEVVAILLAQVRPLALGVGGEDESGMSASWWK